MNPLKMEAAQYVQHTWIMGMMTALFLAFFVGWIWWAFSRRNREQLEAAAMLPLSED
jgi:cbb3-type cytochrome oxidase subunit 3